jgi:hypothetical protein
MIQELYPYQIIKNIVESTSDPMTHTCYFDYGYWPEIANNLTSKGQDATLAAARYPLVMVSAGYKFKKEDNKPGGYATLSDFNVYIIDQSDKNYSTIQRETLVYQAIINPVYIELMQKLHKSPYFLKEFGNNLPHSTENLYYLRVLDEKKLPINNFYDAKEIKFDDLRLNNTYVCL